MTDERAFRHLLYRGKTAGVLSVIFTSRLPLSAIRFVLVFVVCVSMQSGNQPASNYLNIWKFAENFIVSK